MSNALTMTEAVALGPTHLAGQVRPIPDEAMPWYLPGAGQALQTTLGQLLPQPLGFQGQLVGRGGGTRFHILFNGALDGSGQYIVNDPHPSRVVAEDVENGERILLIDFGIHGYDQLFVYGPKPDDRELSGRYSWKEQDTFSVLVVATYNNDYDDPAEGYAPDAEGMLTINTEDGVSSRHSMDEVRRNGFDWFNIYLVCRDGSWVEVVNAELA